MNKPPPTARRPQSSEDPCYASHLVEARNRIYSVIHDSSPDSAIGVSPRFSATSRRA